MTRLVFENAVPMGVSSPDRMDVACFVGFIRYREGAAAPEYLERWLDERGWTAGPHRRESAASLLEVPVPIESWRVFDQLFAWESRQLDRSGAAGSTYLGAAVRSFFAQGGRRCYVVRVGDPWMLSSRRGVRLRRIEDLVPGFPSGTIDSSPVSQQSWRGIGHLFGLPDVSLLCLPDLPDIVAADPLPPARAVRPPVGEEHFVECTSNEFHGDDGEESPADEIARLYFAPRADADSYANWADALHHVTLFLRRQRPDVQLVAAVPIPVAGSREESALFEEVLSPYLEQPIDVSVLGLGSSFLQLAYPWARTPGSTRLPEQLESPDAILAGVLARNALGRGAFRTAAGARLADVSDLFPALRHHERTIHVRINGRAGHGRPAVDRSLVERVSLLGRLPSGWRLLSDVTASRTESYRPASVHRLVSVIARAARRLGEGATFEASGEALWARLRDELGALLFELLEAGALRGRTATEAFQVRCDRTTMTQSDIDNGRVIAQVQFVAAAPIELIRLTLMMTEGGNVMLVDASSTRQEAA